MTKYRILKKTRRNGEVDYWLQQSNGIWPFLNWKEVRGYNFHGLCENLEDAKRRLDEYRADQLASKRYWHEKQVIKEEVIK